MGDVLLTRASLLVRLRDPADGDAWRQFVALYGGLVYGFARGAAYRTPTRPISRRMSFWPSLKGRVASTTIPNAVRFAAGSTA